MLEAVAATQPVFANPLQCMNIFQADEVIPK
jgi:hypothetical protein